jgi:hypothetical protein
MTAAVRAFAGRPGGWQAPEIGGSGPQLFDQGREQIR